MNKSKKMMKMINKHKPLLAIVVILLSLVLVVGTTYSWLVSNDEKINRVEKNRKKLSATINGNFDTNFYWEPGDKENNELTILNDGELPAFVRVSLYEFFASMELNMTDGTTDDTGGNASIKTYSSDAGGKSLKIDDISTWEIDSYLKVGEKKYWKVKDTYISDINKSDFTKSYQYKDTYRPIDAFNYLTIEFNEITDSKVNIYSASNKPPEGTKNYWYYSDGYFYYSEILSKNESTIPLIKSLKLSADLPNKYKGALYELSPIMDAHEISHSVIEDWGISVGNGDYLEKMYKDQLR